MKNKFQCITLLFIVILVGCGSSDDNEMDLPSDLESDLILYSTESDHYLKISKSGNVHHLKCSINDGYIPVEQISGTYLENKLTLNYYGEESTSTLLEISDSEYRKYTDSLISSYDIAENVPDYCENDAIEITSFSPKSSTAGVETEFVINIDYRLASSESALIYPKFSSAALNKFSYNYDKIDILAGTRSASFTTMMTPLNSVDIESLFSVRMMGLVENNTSVYYEKSLDSEILNISAPESPIISESYTGSWTTDCFELEDLLNESSSRKYSYEISNDEITWSYDLYSDHNCTDYLETKASTEQYVDKGMVPAIEGIQVHSLETRFTHGSYIGEPKESFFFAYNNMLFQLSRNEQTGEIDAEFIEPYFLDN
jgi:hypothetical protein